VDYGLVIIICFGMITASWTMIKIFASSNVKRDVKDIKIMCVKMDKTLFGSNGKDGMFVEFRLMQKDIINNERTAKQAHARIDKHNGKEQG